MRRRTNLTYRPELERFEARQLLSVASVTSASSTKEHAEATALAKGHVEAARTDHRQPAPVGTYGYLAFRVTNTPYQTPYSLIPPFQQVLVQSQQPVPGKVYNICSIAVKNGTTQTFTASNNFTVRLTNEPKSFAGFPILTGNEQWKPGQVMVLYVVTKKYYPFSPVSGGFQLDTGGRSSTLVPGPSSIFLRLTYNPATFARTLNWIVAFGQGNQVGKGAFYGLPNTSINELVDARTQRHDFGGHF
jgi:hypothetical protein